MSESPEAPKNPQDSPENKPSGVTIPPKKPIPAASSTEVKPPPVKSAVKPTPTPAAAPTPAAKPVAITPKPATARPLSSPGKSITIDKTPVEKKTSPLGLVIDAVAAVVAITFTVLILLDVKPFL